VTAGTQLEIGVSWSNWCGPGPEAPRLLVVIDEQPVLVMVGDARVPVPPCNGVGQPTTLNVTAFEPSERPPIGD
jgi:hypothetical protein